jgi:hypothetical protein
LGVFCLFALQGFTFALGRWSTYATNPALFALVILEIESCFLPRLWFFYLMLLAFIGMTPNNCHHTQLFSIEMESHKLFLCLGWPRARILLISASLVARITGVTHQHQLLRVFIWMDVTFIKCFHCIDWHDNVIFLV